MNRSEHLTDNQLTDYFGSAAADKEAKYRIGRHLLQCDFCLKKLPQPTTEQFWAALMTDEADDSLDERTLLAERLNSIFQSLKNPKAFALSAAALAILIFLSAFIWLNAARSSEPEVAQNFEPVQSVFNQSSDEKINSPSTLSVVESRKPSSPAKMRTLSKSNSPVTNDTSKYNLKSASLSDFEPKTSVKSANSEKATISSTRGSSVDLPKCVGADVVEMTTDSKSEVVTLKWKKLPKAAKYHLYVSDDDEILVDEYETGQETSYVLKKPLDPVKTYQWKVVITLEDGSTVIGDSQKFTIKNFQSNPKKSERKEKSDIRCLQQN
jgi:hypothetical protein